MYRVLILRILAVICATAWVPVMLMTLVQPKDWWDMVPRVIALPALAWALWEVANEKSARSLDR